MEKSKEQIQSDVKSMYEVYPYPSDPKAFMRYSTAVTEIDMAAKKDLKDEVGKEFLDFGCGTGEVVCGLAKRIPGSHFTGVDMTEKSLNLAQSLKEKENLANLELKQGDLNFLEQQNKSYDEVTTIGVLHATKNAAESFDRLQKFIKPGGHITVALYNSYGRVLNRIKRVFLSLFFGDSVEKRMKFVIKMNGNDKLGATELSRLADRYAHPQESYHTIGEVLRWFKKNNIVYTGSYPPIELNLYPKILYLTWKYRKEKLGIRDEKRLDYLKSVIVSKYWYNPVCYLLVQLIWIFTLKSALFFIRGEKK